MYTRGCGLTYICILEGVVLHTYVYQRVWSYIHMYTRGCGLTYICILEGVVLRMYTRGCGLTYVY